MLWSGAETEGFRGLGEGGRDQLTLMVFRFSLAIPPVFSAASGTWNGGSGGGDCQGRIRAFLSPPANDHQNSTLIPKEGSCAIDEFLLTICILHGLWFPPVFSSFTESHRNNSSNHHHHKGTKYRKPEPYMVWKVPMTSDSDDLLTSPPTIPLHPLLTHLAAFPL